jgi:hypothetical protein
MNDAWPETPFAHLWPERDYGVVQSFRDFDGQEHPAGESWIFIGPSFLPHDDGLSLFVRIGWSAPPDSHAEARGCPGRC